MLTRISQKPTECDAATPVARVASLLSQKRTHCAIVVDKSNSNRMIGLVTTKDLAFRVMALGHDGSTPVGEVMSKNPFSVVFSTSPNEALMLMVRKRIRHLPLVNDETGKIMGVLDITSCFYEALIKMERLASQVKDLQCTVDDLRDTDKTSVTSRTYSPYQNDHLEFSNYSFIEKADPQLDPDLLDIKLHSRKQKIVNDIKSLIETLKQPDLKSLLDENEMNLQPFYLDTKTDVAAAANLMAQNNLTATLIVDDLEGVKNVNNVIGILTTKDLAFRVLAMGLNPHTTKVARVMTSKPHFAQESTGIHTALRLMYEGKYLNLPIKSSTDDMVIGMVNVLHLTRAMLKTLEMTFIKSNDLISNQLILDDFRIQQPMADSNSGPAWDRFWGSLDTPSIRKLPNSRRSSSLALQSEMRLTSSIDSSSEIGLTNKGITLKLQLKEEEGPLLGVNGKIFKFNLIIPINPKDFNVYATIMDKLERRLPILKTNNIQCDIGYYDNEEDFISIERFEDLELAMNEILICKIRSNKSNLTSASTGNTKNDNLDFDNLTRTPDHQLNGRSNNSDFPTNGGVFIIGFIGMLVLLKYVGTRS